MIVQCGKFHMIIVLTQVLLSRKEFVIKYLKKPHMNIVNSTDKKMCNQSTLGKYFVTLSLLKHKIE